MYLKRISLKYNFLKGRKILTPLMLHYNFLTSCGHVKKSNERSVQLPCNKTKQNKIYIYIESCQIFGRKQHFFPIFISTIHKIKSFLVNKSSKQLPLRTCCFHLSHIRQLKGECLLSGGNTQPVWLCGLANIVSKGHSR